MLFNSFDILNNLHDLSACPLWTFSTSQSEEVVRIIIVETSKAHTHKKKHEELTGV